MKYSSRSAIIFRLIWAIAALCVLAAFGFIMVSAGFHSLRPMWRVLILVSGWAVAFLLILKALPERTANTPTAEVSQFPSLALKKFMDAQEALEVGFVALDSHARVVLSNSSAEKLLDIREASASAGLSRSLHPDNAHNFKNTFQDVCQSASGTTILKLRSFDRFQNVHHLHMALTRWKESPAAVIAMMWDISDTEQLKQESHTVKAALHDFQGVFAAEGSGLLDTMRALLELGNLHFRTELGLVAKLKSGVVETLEVVQVSAPHEDLSRGDVFDPTTPSQADFPTVLTHTSFVCCGNDGVAPPVYKASRQETFLGAPINLQGQLYGVLCFASPQDRPEGFSSGEMELVQFIANWLGGEIERRRLIDDFEQKQRRLVEANASLETLLRNDLLTGLINRAALEEALEQEFDRSRIYSLPLSLIVLTPDDFQDYRKNHGEPAWQKLLEKLANAIEGRVRTFDGVARYDESTFVVVYPQTDGETAMAEAQRLQIAIAKIANAHHNFTISIGVVSLQDNCSDSVQLLAQAIRAGQLAQTQAQAQQSTFVGEE